MSKRNLNRTAAKAEKQAAGKPRISKYEAKQRVSALTVRDGKFARTDA